MTIPPPAPAKNVRVRRPTSTTNFGSSRREAHDASAFYERFVPPDVSTDATVNPPNDVDVIEHEHILSGTQPCAPKTEVEWQSNMRVEFRIIQIEAEASAFKRI